MSLHGRLGIHMSTKLDQAIVSAGMCLVVSFFCCLPLPWSHSTLCCASQRCYPRLKVMVFYHPLNPKPPATKQVPFFSPELLFAIELGPLGPLLSGAKPFSSKASIVACAASIGVAPATDAPKGGELLKLSIASTLLGLLFDCLPFRLCLCLWLLLALLWCLLLCLCLLLCFQSFKSSIVPVIQALAPFTALVHWLCLFFWCFNWQSCTSFWRFNWLCCTCFWEIWCWQGQNRYS